MFSDTISHPNQPHKVNINNQEIELLPKDINKCVWKEEENPST